jgi:hypothetical protein
VSKIGFWYTGGGDTDALVESLGFTPSYSSLAGSALAEYLAGKKLPGIQFLIENRPAAAAIGRKPNYHDNVEVTPFVEELWHRLFPHMVINVFFQFIYWIFVIRLKSEIHEVVNAGILYGLLWFVGLTSVAISGFWGFLHDEQLNPSTGGWRKASLAERFWAFLFGLVLSIPYDVSVGFQAIIFIHASYFRLHFGVNPLWTFLGSWLGLAISFPAMRYLHRVINKKAFLKFQAERRLAARDAISA